MIIFELFLSFVKIGFTSFGGMSMIPLILEEMQSHQWMTAEDMSNLIAIAEMTPGPLGINCATFAGTQTAGFIGGLAAVAGVLMPAYTLTLLVAIFFQKMKGNLIFTNVLSVIKPICIAMIMTTILELSAENYLKTNYHPNWAAIVIGLLALYLIQKRKWSVPTILILSAFLGLLQGAVSTFF
ncbi:MAG: chromate transporter [Lachnospiraceae bacterium]